MADITIVFMGFINQHSHNWGAPSSLGATRILSSASERTSWGSSGGVESNLTIQTADAIWKFSWMVYNLGKL